MHTDTTNQLPLSASSRGRVKTRIWETHQLARPLKRNDCRVTGGKAVRRFPRMPDAPLPLNYVFIDDENVPNLDLSSIEGKTVHVTLLLGPKKTKLSPP